MELDLSQRRFEPGLSPYDAWARQIDPTGGVRQEGEFLLQPALVRLREKLDDVARRRLAQAVFDREILLDGWELPLLRRILETPDRPTPEQRRANGGERLAEPRGQFFRMLWRLDDDARVEEMFGQAFDIVERASPLIARGTLPQPSPPPAPVAMPGKGPVIGVIDDGIGFLNGRFRTPGGGTTRFHAIWLQAFHTVPNPPFGGFYTLEGQMLFRSEIDALLARGDQLDEEGVYRTINHALVRPGQHRSLEFSFTHGTAVMDVAGGADAAAPVGPDAPLIAVQLPPEAVDNTAGWHLEPRIVQGVRWILAEADRAFPGRAVVVNVSFATLAGPKDGTKMIEALLAEVLDDWEAATGCRATVLLSFGNHRRERLVARVTLRRRPERLHLRIQPDNREASYVEFRPDDPADLARLGVRVRAPGAGGMLNLGPVGPGLGWALIGPGGTVVGLFLHVPAWATANGLTTPAYYQFALAPTAATGNAARAPAGGWEIELRSTDGRPLPARVEVQRGDTPHGYITQGRQSYLDHPEAYAWEPAMQAYALPGPKCPITRQATHSSFVTARTLSVVAVGAAMGDPTDALARPRPSEYSAEGAPVTIPAPHLSGLADTGPGLRGTVAAGTFSGGARTLSGTSIAAAQAARTVAEAQAALGALPFATSADRDAFIAGAVATFGQAGLPAHAPRLGAGTVERPAGGRERRG